MSAGRSDDPLSPRSSSAEGSDDPLSSRSSTAEVSDDPLSPRSSSAERSEDSLRPRSSVAERAESVLLPLSTASRRRAPFFMVRLVPMHIRFVSFSVEVLFQSAARFRGLKREGGRSRPPWFSGPPSLWGMCGRGSAVRGASLTDQSNRRSRLPKQEPSPDSCRQKSPCLLSGWVF